MAFRGCHVELWAFAKKRAKAQGQIIKKLWMDG
jgi:hypothetical protein